MKENTNSRDYETHPLRNSSGFPFLARQTDHIKIFNKLNKIMLSAADVYHAGKDASSEVLESLREDFKRCGLITDTRVCYEKSTLEATITSYFNSKIIQPKEVKVLIPFYSESYTDNIFSLDFALSKEDCLKYLQTLFNTNNNAELIKKNLENLSGQNSKRIGIKFDDQTSRKFYQNRAVFFYYTRSFFASLNGAFIISNDRLGEKGYSRGIIL